MGKEDFKIFVRKHPNLIDYVTSNKMTWQQFYEIYDLYGEDNSIWNNFNKESTVSNSLPSSIKDFFSLFKGIDATTIQKTLTSINKAIDAFKEINQSNNNTSTYEERPKYKYFED